MYVSLYRKYRPQKFSEIVGQGAATNLLRSSFLEGRLGHAYLFSGPRGCGKTTAARLLAKIVNCENPSLEGEPCCECRSCRSVVAGDHMDVMEIDGASNRGIDQIRELKSHVGLASFMGGKKVYILDEVHMLTTEAFNALLKTLEEPPSSVLFVFATTEPNKVPVTIRSRCQHIPFHRISTEDMVEHLKKIAALESVEAEEPALWEIARSADGALRDALSLSEQAIALGNGRLDLDAVRALFGGGSRQEIEAWLSSMRATPANAASALKSLLEKGVTPERFLDALFPLLRDMWVFALWGEGSFDGVSLSDDEKNYIRAEAPEWGADMLRRAAGICASLLPRARWGLKSDVFSGLLLFEMMGILEGEAATAPAPAQTQRPLPPAPPAASKPARKAPVELPPENKITAEAPEPAKPEAQSPAPTPEKIDIGKLEGLDLPLAAALINVKLSIVDGALVFDFSEAPQYAKSILEMPRARHLVEKAFGISLPESSEQPAPPTPKRAENSPVPAGAVKKNMTIEERAAYLGADLLVFKPLTPQEDESADESPEIYAQPELQE